MKVSIAPSSESIVQERLESGLYRDAGEVVDKALRLLAERDREHDELMVSIKAAFEELEQGGGVEYTPELRKQMWEAAMRDVEAGVAPSKDIMP